MGAFVDHYIILGLPTGEEGSKLSKEEIKKAYRIKALVLHPDKRPKHPNAVSDFQQLQASYAILKDEKTREAFHTDLIIQVKQQKSQQASKHRKMMRDPPKEKEEEKASSYSYLHPDSHSPPDSHSYLHSHSYPDSHSYADWHSYRNSHPYPDSHSYPHSHSYPDSNSYPHSHLYPDSDPFADWHLYRNLHPYPDSKCYSNSYGNDPRSCSSCYSYSNYHSSTNGGKWATQRPKVGMPFGGTISCSGSCSCSYCHYTSLSYKGTWSAQQFMTPKVCMAFGDSVPCSSSWSCSYPHFSSPFRDI